MRSDSADQVITFWDIVQKVQLACFLWGFGTAIGELPPYFMARGARLVRDEAAQTRPVYDFAV